MSLFLRTLEIRGIKDLGRYEINLQRNLDRKIKRIGILNLMPKKEETEAHILNMLCKSREDLCIDFIRLQSHESKNTPKEYLNKNYSTFNEVKKYLDGVIITGAPLEKLEFNEVSYIKELNYIFDYLKNSKKASLYICWGAQAALNHFYGIKKRNLNSKIFGVFSHKILRRSSILNGIEDGFKAPHSRHSTINTNDVINNKYIEVLALNELGEISLLKGNYNDYYILGHLEYDKNVLKREYLRDKERGEYIDLPMNYFQGNDLENDIIFSWEDVAEKLYSNWIKNININ